MRPDTQSPESYQENQRPSRGRVPEKVSLRERVLRNARILIERGEALRFETVKLGDLNIGQRDPLGQRFHPRLEPPLRG